MISPITPQARKENGQVVLDVGDGPPLRMDGERTLIPGGDS